MWSRLKAVIAWIWGILATPAATLSLGFLTLGGFLGGVIFWGAFNTALELTNTEEFCISCHEMENNVYEELTRTVHFSNRSGVRASCPDCHVPHEWTDKIARKMQASKEVWGKIFGTINTRRKFLDHRLELAQHEWARLKANDSLECRNCHSSVAMDLSKQTERAATIHTRYLLSGEATCIDCHKGIAHELPNMEGVDPGWKVPPEFQGEELPEASVFDRLERLARSPHRTMWSLDGELSAMSLDSMASAQGGNLLRRKPLSKLSLPVYSIRDRIGRGPP